MYKLHRALDAYVRATNMETMTPASPPPRVMLEQCKALCCDLVSEEQYSGSSCQILGHGGSVTGWLNVPAGQFWGGFDGWSHGGIHIHATPTGISVPLSFPILRPAASSRGPELCFCADVIYRRCLSAWLTLCSDREIRPHEEGLLLTVLSML